MLAAGTLRTSRGSLLESVFTCEVAENGLGLCAGSGSWAGAGNNTACFASAPGGELYVYTIADSGKAKRIRRSGVVKIAPCDARGKLTGKWLDARAEIVGRESFVLGMRLINRKYWPLKQILDLFALFARHERVMIVIRAP